MSEKRPRRKEKEKERKKKPGNTNIVVSTEEPLHVALK
jgi:hypothetical protein